jgi:hypothetical protein
MTSFMSVGWGPSRQVTRQAGGLQPRTSEDVQGVGWAAAEASPAESPGEPHEAGGNADPPSRTRVEVPGVFFNWTDAAKVSRTAGSLLTAGLIGADLPESCLGTAHSKTAQAMLNRQGRVPARGGRSI